MSYSVDQYQKTVCQELKQLNRIMRSIDVSLGGIRDALTPKYYQQNIRFDFSKEGHDDCQEAGNEERED